MFFTLYGTYCPFSMHFKMSSAISNVGCCRPLAAIVNSFSCPLILGKIRKFHSYDVIYDISILSFYVADIKVHSLSVNE